MPTTKAAALPPLQGVLQPPPATYVMGAQVPPAAYVTLQTEDSLASQRIADMRGELSQAQDLALAAYTIETTFGNLEMEVETQHAGDGSQLARPTSPNAVSLPHSSHTLPTGDDVGVQQPARCVSQDHRRQYQ